MGLLSKLVKFLLRLPLYCLGTLLVACILIVFFGVGDEADVQLGWKLSHDDVVRAKKILHEGSKTRPEEMATIALSKEDLSLAANYLLNRYSNSAVRVSLKPNQLKINATVTLPPNKIGKYVNATLAIGNEDGAALPSITKFKAGRLLLPPKFAGAAINYVISHSALNDYFLLATRPIQAVDIKPDKITISYFSSLKTLIQAQNLLTRNDSKALGIYRQRLGDIIAGHNPKMLLSLAKLLKPLFILAQQRSTLDTAIEENRMAIIAVNDYVNKGILPQSKAKQPRYTAVMYKRGDLAQHFIASAVITASLDKQVSAVVGEEKELNDSQGGSGFSFIDIAADKAGTLFGELATASPEQARKLQAAMAAIKDYNDFMPDPRDLPEHMQQAEFKARFGAINSEAYRQVVEEIDKRIAAMPIYQ
jgi:hypothetical protein